MNVQMQQIIIVMQQMVHVQILMVVLPAHVMQDGKEMEQPVLVWLKVLSDIKQPRQIIMWNIRIDAKKLTGVIQAGKGLNKNVKLNSFFLNFWKSVQNRYIYQ